MGARIMMRSSGWQRSPLRMACTIWSLDLVEELARVGGEGFDVAALALGINGVKGEGGFAGAGKAGDDGEGVAGDFDADVLEVVLARAADYEFRQAHDPQNAAST